MSKYRRKPVEVDAWQYTGKNADELHTIFGRMKRDDPFGKIGVISPGETAYQMVKPGEWIVRQDGVLSVYKPEDFAAMYEPAK